MLRWALHTITLSPPTDARPPLSHTPQFSDLSKDFFWGLSGVVLSIFVSVMLQMFGVDDPPVGRLALGAIVLWLWILSIYVFSRRLTAKGWRVIFIVLVGVALVIAGIKSDRWFMKKRQDRGGPMTPKDFVAEVRKQYPNLFRDKEVGARQERTKGDTRIGEGAARERPSGDAGAKELSAQVVPFVTIHSVTYPSGNIGMDYGLSAVAHVFNPNDFIVQIESLQISGDQPVDCAEFIQHRLKPGDYIPTASEKYYKECLDRKPYFHLTWVANPEGGTTIRPKSDTFVEFTIMEPSMWG